MIANEQITTLAKRLYEVYRKAHPWIRAEWNKMDEEFREVWYAVAVEARKK